MWCENLRDATLPFLCLCSVRRETEYVSPTRSPCMHDTWRTIPSPPSGLSHFAPPNPHITTYAVLFKISHFFPFTMTSTPHLDSFYSQRDECKELFDEGRLKEGMDAWEEACKSITEHVERVKLARLQRDFITVLQDHGLDDAANEVREYMCKEALAVFDRKGQAPPPQPHRTSTTDDVKQFKSSQQHYFVELAKLNQTNQAYLFGEPESNAAQSSVSVGHHPGINRTASAPVAEGSHGNDDIDSRQLKWKQPRSYTTPNFTDGPPAEEDHDTPSGWRHSARSVYTRRHEEKTRVGKGGSSKS